MTRLKTKTEKLLDEIRLASIDEELKGKIISEIHRLQSALEEAYNKIDGVTK